MTRPRKILILLFIIILIPLIFSNLIQYQQVANFSFTLLKVEDYPLIGSYMSSYLFWSSIALLILLIISFILVILTPENESKILISQEKGSLSIKRNAIEQFVLLALSKESWLTNPNLSIRARKKTLKIIISANCSTSDHNIISKTSDLSLRIKQELVSLLGLDGEKQISVEIKQFSDEKNNTSRVV